MVKKGLKVYLEDRVHQVDKDRKDPEEIKVQLGIKVPPDHKVYLAIGEILASLVKKEAKEMKGFKDQREILVIKDLKEIWVQEEPQETKDPKAQKGIEVQREIQELRD